MTGRTSQLSLGTKARLGGGSARAERLENDLRRPGDVGRRSMGSRRRRDKCQRISDGSVDPAGKDLPDVACIIGVAIEMLGGRLELGIQGRTPDTYPEREEQDDRKEAPRHLTHGGIVARVRGPRVAVTLRSAAPSFLQGWRATILPPPGIARFSALSQMLALTWSPSSFGRRGHDRGLTRTGSGRSCRRRSRPSRCLP